MGTLTPYLCCADTAAAIGFYRVAFGAVEVERWTADDGRIGHAQLDLQGNTVYLADEHPEIGVVSPATLGRTPVSFTLEVGDADAAVRQAVAAGATVERPVTDGPDGSRSGWIVDPAGYRWQLSTPAAPSSAQVRGYEISRPGEISGESF